MRIFYASGDSPNGDFKSTLWRDNLLGALVDLGHDVVEFDYDLGPTLNNANKHIPEQLRFMEANRPKVSEELLRQIFAAHRKKPVDLFFSYFYDACVLPGAIDEIKSHGIFAVNWYCNGSYQLDLVSEISPRYDWCLVPEKIRLADYRAMGARPIYCQEAANPKKYRPFDTKKEYDVTFVGQAYGDRPAIIRNLIDKKLNVHVWGAGWERFSASYRGRERSPIRRAARIGKALTTTVGWKTVLDRLRSLTQSSASETKDALPAIEQFDLPEELIGPVLSDEEMIAMFSRSKINLGFSSVGESHRYGKRLLQVRLRDFEIPMSGGFYIVEYMEELEEFFEIGKEVVCYTSADDLAEKVAYYLLHEEERERIRLAGFRRAQRDHTWQNRFGAAFRTMGLENR